MSQLVRSTLSWDPAAKNAEAAGRAPRSRGEASDRRPLGRWAAVFVTALGLSCGDDAELLDSAVVGCTTAEQCSPGLTCVSNTCVLPAAAGQLSVEVTPAGDSAFVRTQLLDVPVDGQTVNIRLTLPTLFEIQVLDSQDVPIAADVRLFATNAIPGRELATSTFVSASDPAPLRLVEGDYSVFVQPAIGPGLEVQDFTVRSRPDLETKTFKLPERYRRLSGVVTSERSNQVRLGGVRVRAFGDQSGLVSTTTVTDGSGAYELLLPDTKDEQFFRVEATQAEDRQPTWSYQRLLRVEQDEDRIHDIPMELVNPGDQGTARLQIVGLDRLGIPQPVQNALVTLTATVPIDESPHLYTVSGTTNSEGLVRPPGRDIARLSLIRARYRVEVLPPSTSEFGQQIATIDLTNAGRGFSLDEQISVPRRTEISGTLRSAQDQPIRQALVSFRPLRADLIPRETVSDADGLFTVLVDPGPYIMVVEPLETNVGDEAIPVFTVAVEITDAPSINLSVVQAPVGVVVQGAVLGPSMAPEPNARLEFFEVLDMTTVQVGTTKTDANGRFEVIVAAR